MEVDDLLTFVEIADAGGVSVAARRMGLSKSAVSRRLYRLEAEMGVQLIARTTRGTALTEAGAAFRDYAARIGAELEAARDVVSPHDDLRGRIRISAPLSLGPSHLAPVLIEFAERHPLLHIHTSYSDRFVDMVAEGFDCAVRIGYLPDSALSSRRVAPIRGKIVASPNYITKHGAPETFEALGDHDALIQGTETWQFTDGGNPVHFHPRGRFKADSGIALTTAAVAGLGVALLPDFLTDELVADGSLVQVMTRYPVAEAGMYVVRPPSPHPSRKVRALTELLLQRFQETHGRG